MSGNSAFELVNKLGWQAGLKNMLRAEFKRWWKTRTWWNQSIIWIGAVDLILATLLFTINTTDEVEMSVRELINLYGLFGGLFTSVGVVIMMQGTIVGEKISGTAAWLFSKPLSIPAFLISKLVANAFGVAVTAILLPGIGAYLILSIGTGESLQILDFIAGIGILMLFSFYWLALTLMLGTFFNTRGPVIGIPLALLFGQQFVLGVMMTISPKIINFLPYPLVMPSQDELGGSIVGNVIMGISPPSWIPVISSMIAILIFIVVGIWRFRKEEF
ncbi:MAG: hypothetical protein GTO18_07585 [Anaerolineales bacterium]|nr:hypothetical protein [Anaerolineales bacterium]